jgi:hypothetical protein
MGSLLALVLAACFGAADQYLGSFSAHPLAIDVSLLSAPWLVLPFIAGLTQRDPRKAAVLGLGCTFAALTSYMLMTLSPIENAHMTARAIAGFLYSESRVIIGGLFTGPLFGWLGNRWRERRPWAGAVLAGAVCLEPLAHALAGSAIRFGAVSLAEVAVGLALLSYFGWTAITGRTHTD